MPYFSVNYFRKVLDSCELFAGSVKLVSGYRNSLTEWTVIDTRDELVIDISNVSCLLSWSPSPRGSWLRLNYYRYNRRSEILSHFWPRCGPVQLIVTPCPW